jgi:hypothetical protein
MALLNIVPTPRPTTHAEGPAASPGSGERKKGNDVLSVGAAEALPLAYFKVFR